jgi:hypothetical protein
MNPMFAAIKKRRGGGLMGDHEASHQSQHAMDNDIGQAMESGDGKDLHGLVASLSDGEKQKLKSLLDGHKPNGIEKGEPSSDERGKIAERAKEEDAMHAMEDASAIHDDGDEGVDSDSIAASMIDHKAKSAIESGAKPRNLGERMKMGLAQKLKSKGKL